MKIVKQKQRDDMIGYVVSYRFLSVPVVVVTLLLCFRYCRESVRESDVPARPSAKTMARVGELIVGHAYTIYIEIC
jgi:hypothetical protein